MKQKKSPITKVGGGGEITAVVMLKSIRPTQFSIHLKLTSETVLDLCAGLWHISVQQLERT